MGGFLFDDSISVDDQWNEMATLVKCVHAKRECTFRLQEKSEHPLV